MKALRAPANRSASGSGPLTPLDPETVAARTAVILRRNPDAPIFIEADEAISYGQYVRAQELLIQAGAKKITQIVDSSETAIQ